MAPCTPSPLSALCLPKHLPCTALCLLKPLLCTALCLPKPLLCAPPHVRSILLGYGSRLIHGTLLTGSLVGLRPRRALGSFLLLLGSGPRRILSSFLSHLLLGRIVFLHSLLGIGPRAGRPGAIGPLGGRSRRRAFRRARHDTRGKVLGHWPLGGETCGKV